MPYTRTKRQLANMFRGPSADGLMTTAKFKKITTPPPVRIFNRFMRPHCPFKYYRSLRRNKKPFDQYLQYHRWHKHPNLTVPPINLSSYLSEIRENQRNPWTPFSQNEPNSKTCKIAVTPYYIKTNASSLKPAPPKNEPKRTQSVQKNLFRILIPL